MRPIYSPFILLMPQPLPLSKRLEDGYEAGRYPSRATDQVALLGGFLENVGIQFVALRQSILRMLAALG
jgi:hypothetical protein